jgi:hypothetical protein
MKPLLTTMTREKDTMRTRLIKPDEKVESLWDTIMDERSEFRLFDIKGHSVKCRTGTELDSSPYMFYNDVNVLEDEILFPDELVSNKKNVPFREIRNGVSRIEDGVLPSAIRHLEKGMEAFTMGKDPMKALKAVKDRDNNSIWSIPKVWETGLKQARKETLSDARRSLLKRTGLSTTQKSMSLDQRLNISDPMETMERDRSFGESATQTFDSDTNKTYQVSRIHSTQETLNREVTRTGTRFKRGSTPCSLLPMPVQLTGSGSSPRSSTGSTCEQTTKTTLMTPLSPGHTASSSRI